VDGVSGPSSARSALPASLHQLKRLVFLPPAHRFQRHTDHGAVLSTALSTIVTDLGIGDNYPWVVNAYMLTSAAVQPVYGQLANLYGRRWITLSAVGLLLFGSGICGGASSGEMLIAGRAIQGIGGGGINMLIELIVCDLVPLRERPKFMGIVFSLFSLGTSMGPFIGGALAQGSSWRWVFYINLPIGGVSFIMLFFFFNVNHKRTGFKQSLVRFDWLGSFLVITSTVAIIFALTYGGARYPWSSWRVIVPLVLGLVGLASFHAWEAFPWTADPLLPAHLFGNRTSAISFFATFLQAFLFVWVIYFLPVYFQGVLNSSTMRSGVQSLPTVVAMIPFALVGAQFVEKTGRYKPVHFVALALTSVGLGTFSFLEEDSSTGMWVGLQLLHVAGAGIITTALLPAIQALLTDADNASSTAAASYIRSYGAIWGLTIPAAIFNNQFEKNSHWISDAGVRDRFGGGNAYSLGTKEFMSTITQPARSEVVSVFVASLRITWIAAAAIAAAGALLTLLEKEVELRTELDTDFGLKIARPDVDAETGPNSP
jgi:MFS family permease